MKERISQLMKDLEKALSIDEREIAEKIRSTGFKCRRCARCCMEEYGDNTVSVFPFEIRGISERTGLDMEDIAVPAPSDDMDPCGNIHTFEWVLRKNGDCSFLKNGQCSIYEHRPRICKTYPFYLQEGHLLVSECEGIGAQIGDGESLILAAQLKERYINELKESIMLLERFRGFEPGENAGLCVHDSEGEHWVSIKNIRANIRIYETPRTIRPTR